MGGGAEKNALVLYVHVLSGLVFDGGPPVESVFLYAIEYKFLYCEALTCKFQVTMKVKPKEEESLNFKIMSQEGKIACTVLKHNFSN